MEYELRSMRVSCLKKDACQLCNGKNQVPWAQCYTLHDIRNCHPKWVSSLQLVLVDTIRGRGMITKRHGKLASY